MYTGRRRFLSGKKELRGKALLSGGCDVAALIFEPLNPLTLT